MNVNQEWMSMQRKEGKVENCGSGEREGKRNGEGA